MRTSRKIKFLVISILSLTGLCLLLTVTSAISNLSLPQASPVIETLSQADKIRLAETKHLIQVVGSNLWSGWGQADIPTILYNESFAFLAGYPDPPAGWVKVPVNIQRGGEWEVTPGDTYDGQPYYRQRLPGPNITPEAFTVLVGERWVSSMGTLDWMKISLAQSIRLDLPAFLQPIFPYRLLIQGLVNGSDQYISLIAHETFHAYQGMTAPDKLARSEQTNTAYAGRYPWNDAALQGNWQTELDLLAEGLKSADEGETIDLARRFLAVRAERRSAANLSQELVAFEQQREWLEGLARYTELEIWRLGSLDGYTPLPETDQLADFDRYTGFDFRWSRELSQLPRMASDEGDGRFYYSGMSQAFLLDRLAPDWKTRAFDEDVWLEELLEEALR
jgi:hypothetical protein